MSALVSDKKCPVCKRGTLHKTPTKMGTYFLYICSECDLHCTPDAFGLGTKYNDVYRTAEYEKMVSERLRVLNESKGRELANVIPYESFFARIKPSENKRLLDVGCGVGLFCHGAQAHGWVVKGIDVASRPIEIGKQWATFEMEVSTLELLHERSETFDVITAFEVLEHLSDPLQFLTSARQLLNPQGQIFCTVPNWDSQEVQTAKQKDWLPPIHLLYFTQLALGNLGESTGLKTVTGITWTGKHPQKRVTQIRWLRRRLLNRHRSPLGLWLHLRSLSTNDTPS